LILAVHYGFRADSMSDAIRNFQLFVSSPMDARFERTRLERVVERLNGEFHGVARLTTIRWENEFYKAHETFQAQIPQAANCDLVVAIFRARLGTELPGDFPRMADDRSYPSGSAYEVLSAIKASKKRGAPDTVAQMAWREGAARPSGSLAGVAQGLAVPRTRGIRTQARFGILRPQPRHR
jgi:hypothetical protein